MPFIWVKSIAKSDKVIPHLKSATDEGLLLLRLTEEERELSKNAKYQKNLEQLSQNAKTTDYQRQFSEKVLKIKDEIITENIFFKVEDKFFFTRSTMIAVIPPTIAP